LENKIKNQAERLYELQKYKDILEKKILQLSPNEVFPLTESKEIDYVLTAHFNESNKFNSSNNLKNKSNKRDNNDIIPNNSTNFKDAFACLQNVIFKFLSFGLILIFK
jgi:uncharacterized membrane protein